MCTREMIFFHFLALKKERLKENTKAAEVQVKPKLQITPTAP